MMRLPQLTCRRTPLHEQLAAQGEFLLHEVHFGMA